MTTNTQIQCVECSHRPPQFKTAKNMTVGDGWPAGEHFVIDVGGGS